MHNTQNTEPEYKEFHESLIKAGLFNKIFVRLCLSEATAAHVALRSVLLIGIAWAPMLILAVIQGVAWGNRVNIPFLYDTGILARFLISFPLLILAEKFIGQNFSSSVHYLKTSGIVRPSEKAHFNKELKKTLNLFEMIIPECVIIGVIVLTGAWSDFQLNFSSGITHWHADPASDQTTLAGYWYSFAARPLYKFLILRWVWRYIVWIRFLWRVSKLRLTLSAIHPDMAGGLMFLGINQMRFGILGFAVAAQASAYIARRVLFEGAAVSSFLHIILGFVVCVILLFLLPLLIFSPQLIISKRRGYIAFGVLAEKYTDQFERHWLKIDAKESKDKEDLLGSADIQSLADLGSSFAVVRNMQWYPFPLVDFLWTMALSTAGPFLPLLFFMYPFDELLKRIVSFII